MSRSALTGWDWWRSKVTFRIFRIHVKQFNTTTTTPYLGVLFVYVCLHVIQIPNKAWFDNVAQYTTLTFHVWLHISEVKNVVFVYNYEVSRAGTWQTLFFSASFSSYHRTCRWIMTIISHPHTFLQVFSEQRVETEPSSRGFMWKEYILPQERDSMLNSLVTLK